MLFELFEEKDYLKIVFKNERIILKYGDEFRSDV